MPEGLFWLLVTGQIPTEEQVSRRTCPDSTQSLQGPKGQKDSLGPQNKFWELQDSPPHWLLPQPQLQLLLPFHNAQAVLLTVP